MYYKSLKKICLSVMVSIPLFAGCSSPVINNSSRKSCNDDMLNKTLYVEQQIQNKIILNNKFEKESLIFKPIRPGSNRKIIKDVQNRLKVYGYTNIVVDGIYGESSIRAIKDFQFRNFLDVDGVVGEATFKKLLLPPTEKTKFTSINWSNFFDNKTKFINTNTFISKTQYFIIVDTNERIAYIYKGFNKNWTLFKKCLICVGKNQTPTIKGMFRLSGVKGYSFGKSKGFQAKYFTQIEGNYLFHSVIYNASGTSITDGRLGYAISHGCIRMSTEDAKFIFNNINKDTVVIIK